jgi:hypothetical protein
MRKLAYLLLAVALVFTSCTTKKHDKKTKVTAYKVANTTTADPNDWFYYYVIFNSRSNQYYYYTSPTPVTDFSTTSDWTTASQMPTELTGVTPDAEFEETLTELPDQIEVDMENTIDVDVDSDGSGAGSAQEEDGGSGGGGGGE